MSDPLSAHAIVADHVARAAEWLELGLDAIGGAIIAVGAATTVFRLVRLAATGVADLRSERLTLALFLTWALEFQLAADIVSTAIAPDWTKIGQVAAIAAIRTGLNIALTHEMNAESSGD